MAKFASQDPAVYDERLLELLLDPQSLNSYAYCRNNPVGLVDETGERAYNVTVEFTRTLNFATYQSAWFKNSNTAIKASIFAFYVNTGGPWDIKNSIYEYVDYNMDSVVIGNKEYAKDILGNIIYGFTGAILGFDENNLKLMAGVNEIAEGDGKVRYFYSYFDDPKDQKAIELGIKLYETYGDHITEANLMEILKNSMLELRESRAEDICKDKNHEE